MWGKPVQGIEFPQGKGNMCHTECTCKGCQPVTAFKSLNGSLYLSKEECQRHNKIWKDRQQRTKVYEILKKCLDRPMDHYKVYYNIGMSVDEVARFIAYEDTNGFVWRDLRNALNSIED